MENNHITVFQMRKMSNEELHAIAYNKTYSLPVQINARNELNLREYIKRDNND